VLCRDPSRMPALGAGVSVYTEVEEFLDAVDIVGFAVPPHVQDELAATAIARGKHVLLEKPVSTTAEVAQRLAHAAQEKGIHSITFFPHRLDPVLSGWSRDMREHGAWWAGRVEAFSSVLVDEGSPFHSSQWRHDSGGLWDIGPHAVAQLCAVLGNVASVCAQEGAGKIVSVSLGHKNGAQSSIALGASFPAPAPDGIGTYFIGERGRALQPGFDDWITTARGAYGAAIESLVDQMQNRVGSHVSDIHFGAHVTSVLAAAERSMASGRAETV